MSSHRKYKRGNKVMHFRVGMDTFFSSFPDWNFSGPFHPSVSDFFGGRQVNKSMINPENIAYGAAFQATVITGQTSNKTADLLLLDVAPLLFGVAMQDDVFGLVVPQNADIPTNTSQTFLTVEENQSTVTLPVYKGEHVTCNGNQLLGEFEVCYLPAISFSGRSCETDAMFYIQLSGITLPPLGQAKLVCTFEFNSNELLKVLACD